MKIKKESLVVVLESAALIGAAALTNDAYKLVKNNGRNPLTKICEGGFTALLGLYIYEKTTNWVADKVKKNIDDIVVEIED